MARAASILCTNARYWSAAARTACRRLVSCAALSEISVRQFGLDERVMLQSAGIDC